MPQDMQTLNDGTTHRDLGALLGRRLHVPWEYSVLAACTDPEDAGRTHAVLRTHNSGPDQYVVYRVDSDGHCHGGYYASSLFRALGVFQQRLAGLVLAQNEREMENADVTG